MRLEHIENKWWMKPTVDEEGNAIEEFFWCVDTEYYTQDDYTLVTNEYKEQWEAEHMPDDPDNDLAEEPENMDL